MHVNSRSAPLSIWRKTVRFPLYLSRFIAGELLSTVKVAISEIRKQFTGLLNPETFTHQTSKCL